MFAGSRCRCNRAAVERSATPTAALERAIDWRAPQCCQWQPAPTRSVCFNTHIRSLARSMASIWIRQTTKSMITVSQRSIRSLARSLLLFTCAYLCSAQVRAADVAANRSRIAFIKCRSLARSVGRLLACARALPAETKQSAATITVTESHSYLSEAVGLRRLRSIQANA